MNFVESRYTLSDTSRFTKNYKWTERMRFLNQTSQMAQELDYIFSSPKKYTVWGGHSIWFRQFFKHFGDLSDPTCKELMDVKIANTGLVTAQLQEIPGSP